MKDVCIHWPIQHEGCDHRATAQASELRFRYACKGPRKAARGRIGAARRRRQAERCRQR
jgi:hypothetical protein